VTPDFIFTWANYGALVFWALLVVAPGWRGTQIAVHSAAPVFLLGSLYAGLAFPSFFGSGVPEGASFTSLDGLMVFFTYKPAVVAGWVHYLVFDLFIGAWEVRDARRRGVHHLYMVPCLLLTLLLGPIGLMLYLVIRAATGKGGFLLDER
jgi:hypothetical protein